MEPEQLAFVAPAKSLALVPVQPFVPRQIPPREWLYGRAIIRRYISMVVAPGGTGKSALTMVEAVAMATGKTLLPGDNPVSPLRVWLHNAEDDRLELQRRLAAALQHHKLTLADLNNNLILSSGRDVRLSLARDGADGPKVDQRSVDRIVEQARELGVDVIMLDPLGALHTLPENSNEAMNLLMGALREIADKARVAVVLVHHTSKVASTNMSAAGAGASRGASALVDAVRSSRQLGQMTDKEAGNFGVPLDRRWEFIRVDNGKANLAPAQAARWVKLVGVSLNNGNVQYPQGDTVQTVEHWTPPTPTLGSAADLINVQRAVSQAAAPPRWSDKSPDWVGYLVADATGLDIGEPASGQKGRDANQNAARRKVVAMLNAWKREGALTTIKQHDGRTGRMMEVVEVGKSPAEPVQMDPQVVPGW
ncbi:AAA family ATPase [Devosia ginsengisoli]|uniref:AAA family ATPase n=1 Tax=Devosia ginsengisoli TaxID=400770 RepID=A0A5B8LVH1_9HYPH|nr:AAA family ATPase [Devosia ginsengisoli]